MKNHQHLIKDYFEAQATVFQLAIKTDEAYQRKDWELFFTLVSGLYACDQGLAEARELLAI